MKVIRVKYLSVKKYIYMIDDDDIQPREFLEVPVTDQQTGSKGFATAVVASICSADEAEIELAQAKASGYTINKCRRLPKKFKKGSN